MLTVFFVIDIYFYLDQQLEVADGQLKIEKSFSEQQAAETDTEFDAMRSENRELKIQLKEKSNSLIQHEALKAEV